MVTRTGFKVCERPLVVLMVKVLEKLAFVAKGLAPPLNAAVAPVGSAVVTLRFIVHKLLLPTTFTATL